jgi:hypothetical protein
MSLADTRRTKPRQQPFSRFGSEHQAASSESSRRFGAYRLR